MSKRASKHDSTDHGLKKTKPDTVFCEYCGKQFSTRGIKRHQTSCKNKKSWTEAHTPRSYNFCILTELVFETILSFMSNQTQTKMQMITGDHYSNCEPDLAKWCCKCENDNLTTFDHLCRECEYATNGFNRCVTQADAQRFYGVENFSNCSEDSRNSNRYYLYELEKYMLQECDSKMAWVREVAARRARSDKAHRRKEERKSAIAQLDPDFKEYIYSFKTIRAGKLARYTTLEKCQTKFKELKAALIERGLPSEPDFYYCNAFIMTKSGNLDQVVDNMEEKHFLFTQTEYERLSGDSIDADRHWFVRKTYQAKEVIRKRIKADLCVQYLLDNKDLTIPQKWEKCRQRFDEVVSESLDPKVRALYIYLGEAPAEADHLETH